MKKLIAAIAVAGVAAGLAACSPATVDDDEPTSITIAVGTYALQGVWSVDTVSLWFLTYRPVYESLIAWDDETSDYVPWLAEEYEIAEDGLSMSVKLREDVTFTDGTPMDAEGVVKALNASWGEDGAFWYLSPMSPDATVTGEYTLEITTTRPLYKESILLLQLTTIPILSPAAIDDPTLVKDAPIGTGPYLLDEFVPEVSATYVRNPDYWNPDAFDFDEITMVAMADTVASLNALKTGQIDAAEIDATLAAEADQSDLNVATGSSTFTGLFILDRLGENNPPLGDVRVRQALSYAIDREAIVEELDQGYGDPSSQPFDTTSREFVEGADDRYAYDPDRARELLAEAGYPDGFTMKVPNGQYGPILEQNFRDIGVTIEWIDSPDPYQLASDLEVDGMIFGVLYSYAIAAYALLDQWWVTQPVKDPEFLDLMERYNSAQEHDGVLDEAAKYVLEQAWYIVIAKPKTIWASVPTVDVSVAGGLPGTVLPRLTWFTVAD
jgi:peptide/nickel transport system substrate-binding protein